MMVSWDCSNIGNSWHPAASIDPGYTAFFSGIKTGIKSFFFQVHDPAECGKNYPKKIY